MALVRAEESRMTARGYQPKVHVRVPSTLDYMLTHCYTTLSLMLRASQ